MAKIHTLKIKNYKGLQSFEQEFGFTDFICLIGRGDSGKTTILEAISVVLSPSWNLTFYDTDFFEGNINQEIQIEASLYDIPEELLDRNNFGLHKRSLNKDNKIIDDVSDEQINDEIEILTIRLTVDKELEPKWHVINNRQDPIEIKANDRAKLNVFLVSDYIDKHFSWSKGNPLYSLLKGEDFKNEKTNIMLDAFREAKQKIDEASFSHLENVIKKMEASSSTFGVEMTNTNTTIDFKDLYLKDGKICLHDKLIPFRQKGKGTKRLISIAIQIELAKQGGILLIDEIEQGLEPDRAQHLAQVLKKENKGQVFITTHSSNVIVELEAENLYRVKNDKSTLYPIDMELQGCIRNNPEAFFAKKVLVCEGATEVGICRSMNQYRISKGLPSFSILGIAIVDGSGSNFIKYCKDFNKAEIETCTFCDSDDTAINMKKASLIELGITVVDCDKDNAIENQLFKDLEWNYIVELLEYIIEEKGLESIKQLVENKFGQKLPETWNTVEDDKIRTALAIASTLKKEKIIEGIKKTEDKAWFKRIDHGMFLGEIICKHVEKNITSNSRIIKQYKDLNNWINK
jgi:putative ATP-dependent endonuclease of the OLD family